MVVWPVTGTAGSLSREPQSKQWLYKVSREDTRVGREFHIGGGRLGSLGSYPQLEEAAERGCLATIVQLGKQAQAGRDDPKST